MTKICLRAAEIWTMDEAQPHVRSGDVIVEDGKITWIGPRGIAKPDSCCQQIPLQGRLLLPGFVNCHSHLSLTNLRGTGNNLTLFPWLREMGELIGRMSTDEIESATETGMRELLRCGVTTVCDCGPNGPEEISAIGDKVGLRTLSGFMVRSNWFGREVPENLDRTVAHTIRLINEWRERSGRISFFLGAHSPYTASPDLLRRAKMAANKLQVDFNIHLAENAQEVKFIKSRYGKSPVEYAYDLGLLDRRTIANHCVHVTESDMGILVNSGARVVHCPMSNAKLGSGVARIIEMRDRGIVVGLGTDSAASNDDLSMLLEMKAAVLLQRALHQDPSAFTAMDALRMSTIEAARALGMENEIGSIKAGKRADLIAIAPPQAGAVSGQQALEELVFAPTQTSVQLVIVDGKIILNETGSGEQRADN